MSKDDMKFVNPLKNKENMNKSIGYLKVSKDNCNNNNSINIEKWP